MRTLFFISCLILTITSNAQTVAFDWAKQFGGVGTDQGRALAVDAAGNVYTTGSFNGVADFNPGSGILNLTSAGGRDIFISKLDAAGTLVWAKRLGSTGSDEAFSIVLDAAANLYITGEFEGTVNFDPNGSFNLISNGSYDAFILKIDSASNFIFAKNIGGVGADESKSIAIDGANNIYTTGYFSATADFDPNGGSYTLTPVDESDVFISKLDALGNFVWAKSFEGLAAEYVKAIAVDAAGNSHVTGSFLGTVDFDPGAAVFNLNSLPSGYSDIFITKLNSSGNFVWAKQFAGTNDGVGEAITLDASGNVYTTGYFNGVVDFDPGTGTFNFTTSGNYETFISKLDASGVFVWAAQFAGPNVQATAIKVDAGGNVFTAGSFVGTGDFDPAFPVENLTSGNADVFVSKLTAAGTFVWAKSFGLGNDESASGVDIDAAGNVYTTGYFNGTPDFDPGSGTYTITTKGDYDVFVHRLSPCALPATPTNVTPPSNLVLCAGNSASLSASATGTITWYATSGGTVVLGNGTSFITPTLTAGNSNFYAEVATCTNNPVRLAVTVTVNTCAGIKNNETEIFTMNVFPNPMTDILNVTVKPFSIHQKLEVYNSLGLLVNYKEIQSEDVFISFNDLPGGIYFLKLLKDNKTQTVQKIIKQ